MTGIMSSYGQSGLRESKKVRSLSGKMDELKLCCPSTACIALKCRS